MNENINEIEIKDILVVPGLKRNLISLRRICEKGAKVIFEKERGEVTYNNEIVMKLEKETDTQLYKIIEERNNVKEVFNHEVSVEKWHKRLGHLNYNTIKEMSKENLVEDLIFKQEEIKECKRCREGKQTRKKFKRKTNINTREIGEIIHTDICGPITPTSTGGNKYFITFTDDFSRYSWVYFMKNKSQTESIIKEWIYQFKRQFNKKVKCINSDGGKEYMSNRLKEWYKLLKEIIRTLVESREIRSN